jgi:hypothetical protein
VSRRDAVRVIALLALAAASSLLPARAQEAGLASRTYTARYRSVEEVLGLIQPALSDRGSYSVQPRNKSVTVTDTPEVLTRVQDLIAGFDLPARSIRLVVQLIKGEEGPPPAAPKSPPRRLGLPPSVIQDVTKWGVVTQIGNAALSTAENEPGSVALGDEYRVQFTMGAVSPKIGVVRVERFTLEKLKKGPDGQMRFTPLIDLVLNLKQGQTTVLGATSSQDSRQALFVAVTATAEEEAP